MNSFKNIIIFIIWLVLSHNSWAVAILSDSEMEDVINEAVAPIFKAAELRNKIHIIFLDDPEVNAFTAGNNTIFLNIGLIAKFQNIDVLKAVIAHELGHLIGQHTLRMSDIIESKQKLYGIASAIGVGIGIASGNPSVLMGGIVGGADYTEKTLLKHSREFENSADQAAFRLLEKSGNSASGFQEILNYYQPSQRMLVEDKYYITHPLSSERINKLNEFLSKSKYPKTTTSPKLRDRYKKVSYKILAFTADTASLNLAINKINDSETKLYMQSIRDFRIGKLDNSIFNLDKLLKIAPSNPYYHELKGQVLLKAGKTAALDSFVKASELKPHDILLQTNILLAASSLYTRNSTKLASFIPYAKFIQVKEPDAALSYYYMSLYFQSINDEPMRQIYLALFYDKQNNKTMAKSLAKSALRSLKPNTPQWHWAQDIIQE